MEPHWLEHALLALPIGCGAALIMVLVRYNTDKFAYLVATAASTGGSFYYLGREVRDKEKGTVADGFDYSGLIAPILSCILVFGGAAVVYERPRSNTEIGAYLG